MSVLMDSSALQKSSQDGYQLHFQLSIKMFDQLFGIRIVYKL